MKTKHVYASQIQVDVFYSDPKELSAFVSAIHNKLNENQEFDIEIPNQLETTVDMTEQYVGLGTKFKQE